MRGHAFIEVLLPKTSGRLTEELRARSISVHVLPWPTNALSISRCSFFRSALLFLSSLPALLATSLRMLRLIARLSPDVLHTTGLKMHLWAACFRLVHRKPVVWHLRDHFEPGPVRTVFRGLSRITRVRMMANSVSTARSFGLDFAIRVIPNGVQAVKGQAFDTGPSDAWIFGCVGVLAAWKGQTLFIVAMRRLR